MTWTASGSFVQAGLLASGGDPINGNNDILAYMVRQGDAGYELASLANGAVASLTSLTSTTAAGWRLSFDNTTGNIDSVFETTSQSIPNVDNVNGAGNGGWMDSGLAATEEYFISVTGHCGCASGDLSFNSVNLKYEGPELDVNVDSSVVTEDDEPDGGEEEEDDSDDGSGATSEDGPSSTAPILIGFSVLMAVMVLVAIAVQFTVLGGGARRNGNNNGPEFQEMEFGGPGSKVIPHGGGGAAAAVAGGGRKPKKKSGGVAATGASGGGVAGGKTMEDAIDDLIERMPVNELTLYVDSLTTNGMLDAALALAIKLEYKARTTASGDDYAETVDVLGRVLEARKEKDALNEVKEVRRRTLAGGKPPQNGVSGPGMKSVRASITPALGKKVTYLGYGGGAPIRKNSRSGNRGRAGSGMGGGRKGSGVGKAGGRGRSASGNRGVRKGRSASPTKKGRSVSPTKKRKITDTTAELYESATVQMVVRDRKSIWDAVTVKMVNFTPDGTHQARN